ncbi:hypothetical protein [Microlunatus antarcticus]|uniref:Uncharacterized protein n=1 Tax=Microlunatus antarcticus TaxID=53388 RepID=A0A7W5P5G2_9ACTN|nr:hypothetical protein [Microlunatus antarcticus]MBB3325343.1 hypothetical protein [Microlunatus antarcticus]
MSSRPAPSRRPGDAARREPVARAHRTTQTVLVVGSVLALAATLGPVWLVRAGVVVAVVTCIATCLLAWRELADARRRHAHRLLVADRRHGDALRTERTRNAEVVDALGERLSSTGMVVVGQRATITHLRGEVGVLTTERDALQEQVAERDGLIGLFRASLRDQEAALLAVRAQQSELAAQISAQADAEVHALPRRTRPVDEHHVIDAEMAELAMVLPNYETTRRFAV